MPPHMQFNLPNPGDNSQMLSQAVNSQLGLVRGCVPSNHLPDKVDDCIPVQSDVPSYAPLQTNPSIQTRTQHTSLNIDSIANHSQHSVSLAPVQSTNLVQTHRIRSDETFVKSVEGDGLGTNSGTESDHTRNAFLSQRQSRIDLARARSDRRSQSTKPYNRQESPSVSRSRARDARGRVNKDKDDIPQRPSMTSRSDVNTDCGVSGVQSSVTSSGFSHDKMQKL